MFCKALFVATKIVISAPVAIYAFCLPSPIDNYIGNIIIKWSTKWP